MNCTELDWWDERDVVLPSPSASASAPDSTGETLKVDAESPSSDERITAKIGCLPCQHTSNRGLTDRSLTLWSGWSVESGGKKVYFAGDTGYRTVPYDSDGKGDEYMPSCPAFEQIGEFRGNPPFDLGLIPIGAYEPRWIMSPMHADPRDAVNIFIDTRCKKALGMHWGTWVLTEEDVMEPPEKLREALTAKGIAPTGVFDVLKIGESKCY